MSVGKLRTEGYKTVSKIILNWWQFNYWSWWQLLYEDPPKVLNFKFKNVQYSPRIDGIFAVNELFATAV